MLYPLKFTPILKETIWGGEKLKKQFGKLSSAEKIGESWEISAVKNNVSVLANGNLAGRSLSELIAAYREKLLGVKVYERFGTNFPLLFKFIDANDNLSIQVHPNDETALRKHNSLGKTEMWYVLDAQANGHLIAGFSDDCSKEKYLAALKNDTVENLLQKVPVSQGDALFIPAGLVHAICKGIMVAEIQQSSDLTYRIYDYKRRDSAGNERELHTEFALDAISFSACQNPKVEYSILQNSVSPLVESPFFTVNIMQADKKLTRTYSDIDSFRVYMCVSGRCTLDFNGLRTELSAGETALIPACISQIEFLPQENVKLLETYL